MRLLRTNATPAQTAGIIRRTWSFNHMLTLAIALFVLLIPPTLIAMAVDPTIITGVNGWFKPLKFLISAAIYSATLLWLLHYVDGRRRWVQTIANVTGAVLIIEIGLIMLQTARNTTSHFNMATPFDAVVFGIMGPAITVLAGMNLILAILLLRQRLDDPVFAWALRLGLLTAFAGMMVAFLMTAGPTPEQLAALQEGAPLTIIGAHSVGVPDGGPGLPFLGWSTVGGDSARAPLLRPPRHAGDSPAGLVAKPADHAPSPANGSAAIPRLDRRPRLFGSHAAADLAGLARAEHCCARWADAGGVWAAAGAEHSGNYHHLDADRRASWARGAFRRLTSLQKFAGRQCLDKLSGMARKPGFSRGSVRDRPMEMRDDQ